MHVNEVNLSAFIRVIRGLLLVFALGAFRGEAFAQVIGRPPVITNQPISQIVTAGSTVAFCVGVGQSANGP